MWYARAQAPPLPDHGECRCDDGCGKLRRRRRTLLKQKGDRQKHIACFGDRPRQAGVGGGAGQPRGRQQDVRHDQPGAGGFGRPDDLGEDGPVEGKAPHGFKSLVVDVDEHDRRGGPQRSAKPKLCIECCVLQNGERGIGRDGRQDRGQRRRDRERGGGEAGPYRGQCRAFIACSCVRLSRRCGAHSISSARPA